MTDYLEYQSPPMERVSGMAVAAMVLGLLSFCLGILTGIPAVIFGILALNAINRDPYRYGGKGLAITGIWTGVAGGLLVSPLLLAILVPSIGKSREAANRVYCGANVAGITKAALVYANAGSDQLPVTLGPGGTSGTIPNRYSSPDISTAFANGFYVSPAANPFDCIWLLVLQGSVGTKSLICKSDAKALVGATNRNSAGDYVCSPWLNGDNNVDGTISYSIAFPWNGTSAGGAPYWKNWVDATVPLVSDMALWGCDSASGKGRTLNSFNHAGEGQNVGFSDGHAEWTRTPKCGQGGESIFNNDGTGMTPTYGTSQAVPAMTAAPYGWDILMVPMRDKDGNLK